MMRKYYSFIMGALFLALLVPTPTQAQDITPAEIVSVNKPISAALRDIVTNWLQTSPPSPAVYYAVTYTQPSTENINDIYVSIVGLNIDTPDQQWSIVEDPETGETFVVWLGTILVREDGSVDPDPFDLTMAVAPFAKVANIMPMPQFGAGGGSYVRFPWDPGKAVQYGVFGAHAADYSTSDEWLAVDLISGSDMGSGAASDKVYASVSGTVSFVCDYGGSVAVKVSGNGDSFLYAHLVDNANLELSHSFSGGEYMGNLKHGTFSDQCGKAVQQDDHWHLHWGFITTGSSPRTFRAEGCQMIKSAMFTSGIWECGDITVKILGYLAHYGNITIDPDTGEVGYEGAGGGPSFWTYFVGGMGELFESMFTDNLPEHSTSAPFLYPILNSVKVVLRISLILVKGNFNFIPAVTTILLMLTFKLALSSVFGVIGIVRTIKA